MTNNTSRFGESKGIAKDAIIIRFLTIIFLVGGLQVATQYFAYKFNYQSQLGIHFNHIYEPWAILLWADKWYGHYPAIFDVAASVGVLFSSVGLILVLIIKMVLANSSRTNQGLHGSARWADKKDIEKAGLLTTAQNKNSNAVYVGAWQDRYGKTHYLKHRGPEHVLCYAPTRSG